MKPKVVFSLMIIYAFTILFTFASTVFADELDDELKSLTKNQLEIARFAYAF